MNQKENNTIKELVYFNEQGYNDETKLFKAKQNAFNVLVSELSKYTDVLKKDFPKIRKNPIEYAQQHILNSYSDVNTMNLTYDKLKFILEIDTAPLDKAISNYQSIKANGLQEPNKELFCVYATTPQQVERLKASKDTIEALTRLKKVNRNISLPRLAHNMARTFITKPNGTIEINSHFVLTGNIAQ